ncbi:MAG: exodeoxyribonuclease VII small subunit [Halanaerobium sp. 4-GBenrich]|jgi:exodeoxyribonuclease VII small subunit|uniref:Exodeoxyribonuclease 7 small subunit n=1 Tax=Halanaerobium congolense TaxID=54121 RepID=A0A1G6I1E0_9FIRM|nr:exodeoxyribonuclease VII small subunit [Halanaerobium congolense]ODS50991.1 MAG: exodeoxyribonuclease VII small subunit [Halanaerobium sp. 4-GBenrich]TDP27107.1 exodeoxyribonuclease VII small subunit [Halanaerobium congolense]TDS33622.1 exodeoxyribonuclease VII small subunit [Halanaerobium congolense]TDX45354.1 exodeoxyribonuclease VII small subunit [Halanaerobium congolense]SDC00218.1 Exodeoxyribonuclease VII small subunit [Halanaerobium congolense]
MTNKKDKEDVLDLENLDFESALEKLQKIVEELEKGGLSLDQTLKEFNQGMQLLKFCNQKLDKAEKKIELMIKENDEFKREVPFENVIEED